MASTPPQSASLSAPRQRSPWFYALLGCGALALLICLGGAAVLFGFYKVGTSIQDGVTNVEERRGNAVKQLGAIPEGYDVVMSVSVMGLMQTTALTTRQSVGDGGLLDATMRDRNFVYARNPSDANTPMVKGFIIGTETDPRVLGRSGANVDLSHVLKRDSLELPSGRTVKFATARGSIEMGNDPSKGLITMFLFECPADALQVGMWVQLDATPEASDDELDKAGTVLDEAEMSRFLSQIDPCRK